jgi:hypothetical protein
VVIEIMIGMASYAVATAQGGSQDKETQYHHKIFLLQVERFWMKESICCKKGKFLSPVGTRQIRIFQTLSVY